MRKVRMAIALIAMGVFVYGAFAATNQTVQSEIVRTQSPTGPVDRDLADKDNPESESPWTCQNAQPTACYHQLNPATGEYDIPSSETGFAVAL